MVWLYKVAKNRCLMSRRKSRFSPKEDLSLEELMPDRHELLNLSGSPDGTPETAMLRRESAKRLREAVQKLPSDYRLILVLHDMEELSDGDVAENHRPPAQGQSACDFTGRDSSCERSSLSRLSSACAAKRRNPPRKRISPRSRTNGAARKYSPNSQTILMTS